MRIFPIGLIVLLASFLTPPVADAQRVRRPEKAKPAAKQVKANKAKRVKHRVPKGNQAGFKWWGNQHGTGYKSIEVSPSGTVRETATFRADGSRRAKTVNDKTGSSHIEFSRGTSGSQITRKQNGDWIRRDTTKSGLIRVTTNKPSRVLTYEVPGNMRVSAAQKQAQKFANNNGRLVKLDFDGARRNEAFYPKMRK